MRNLYPYSLRFFLELIQAFVLVHAKMEERKQASDSNSTCYHKSMIQLYTVLQTPVLLKIENTCYWSLASYLTTLNATGFTGWLLLHQIGKTAWRSKNSEHL